MKKVVLPAKPKNFDTDVKRKGMNFLQPFLATGTKLKSQDWKNHDYWNRVKPYLRKSSSSICAYLAMRESGDGEIDHFISKSESPEKAYDWGNYRFANNEVNKHKLKVSHKEILDPCEIEDNWFKVDLISGRLLITKELPEELRKKAETTIEKLKLNKESFCETRIMYFEKYLRKKPSQADLNLVRELAPLVAESLDTHWIQRLAHNKSLGKHRSSKI